MTIGEVCTRNAVFVDSSLSIQEAARQMREQHVGALIIAAPVDGRIVPRGIVTDRDLVLGIMAPGIDPKVFTVGDIMGPELVTALDSDDVFTTVRKMRMKGIRRIPVVDQYGALAGIFTLDDFLSFLAREMREVSGIIAKEQNREELTRVALA